MSMLEVKDLQVYYGVIQALKGISFHVEQGEVIALIGANGAGKTTTLQTLTGIIPAKAGSISFGGKELTKTPAHKIVEMGMAHVPEGRRVFADMSVYENLLMGAYTRKDKNEIAQSLEMVYKRFPRLKERTGQRAGTLSGGEQQRVAIAIALANEPKLLLADEPTGAVDRKTADDILDMFRKLNEQLGITIVIVTHDNELASKVNRVISIRDGKTSSERIMKNEYKNRLEDISIEWQHEEAQEEFVVLDRAGRIQIPSELLKEMGMNGNKVKLEFVDGKIVIENPEE